ncbi:calcium-binding protein [Actinoplanes palleronii]|uniref:Hemolysin type calcium-binding protein n=1 Tax=Actinoplanes palleronii TaxID=113570 RepID=A0ABQ4BEH9_9ACTN|nr:calcium-binding protein [Actinoplanes palleronii]GIE69096.1 hypothetical protein Apa02nite_052040 [Actinoplanes palleronii]
MTRPRWLSRAGATLIAGTAVLTAASPAQAASAGIAWTKDSTVIFTARAGKANNVVITRSGGTVTIDDKDAIKPGRGCKRVDNTKVRCTTEDPPDFLKINLGTRNDRFVNKTNIWSTVHGGTGNDVITGGTVYDVLIGDAGNDVISGGYGNDSLDGSSGNDRVYGGSGSDWVDGGPGNDRVYGGTYSDSVQGGTGNDLVDGGSGNDFLNGEDETVAMGSPIGADIFRGGAGQDTVSYWDHRRAVTVDLDGKSRDDGQPGEHDTVGADIENIRGSAGNDTLTGNAGANEIFGDEGDDTIRGGAGDDELSGYYGRDKLFGEAGDDTLDAIEPRTPAENQQADQADGGDNATSNGDLCKISAVDVVTTCERVENL